MTWHDLIVKSQNAGNMKAAEAIRVARHAGFVCWQEMSDRDDIKKALRRAGHVVIEGTELGQPATPVSYSPDVARLLDPIYIPLLIGDEREWGPGAGPNESKPKWLVGGRFKLEESGRWILVFSAHLPPSQSAAGRLEASRLMANRIDEALDDRDAIVLVGMDANSEPGKPGIRPLESDGWTWSQAKDPTHTHGRRGIDGVFWRKADRDRIRFIEAHTESTHSDHETAVCRFVVKSR